MTIALPSPLISASADRLGGTLVFAGTRVPVQSSFDNLADGNPLDHFVEQFPDVSREHAVAVPELAMRALLTPAAWGGGDEEQVVSAGTCGTRCATSTC